MDKEISDMVERHGISPVRAYQIIRDRAIILRRRPIRSINMMK
jgi:hypothetical protein